MRMKRFLAGFLCLCMVGTMDMPYVQAASVAAKSEPVAQESAKQDAEDAKPSEDVENQDNDQRSEAAKQKEVVKDTQAAEQAESAGSTENKTEQTALLNYALIDQPTVEMPGTQNVLLSIGDENTVIESAVLDYVNETTGKTYRAQASTISQDAMLFTMEFPEGSEAGAYRLVGVTYQINGTEQSLLFQDAGMDMRFGVNTTVETNPDSVVVDEPSADVDVVTMDENGNTESADSIGDAIRNAQAETPATNSMDDVAAMGAAKNIVVVLDPGHDDTHAGARRNGLEEEDLTLKIAQYCKAELSQYNGVTVYMTRESGACANGGGAVTSTECNAKRVEYAQSVGANVYVSMHINAGGGNGAEIFYPNQNYRSDLGTTGHDLAQQILNKILELGIGEHGQGLKIRNSEDNTLYPDGSLADYLGVIRRSKLAGIPAILIEHAYIDTSDANYLNSDEKLMRFGVADATGIANYYGLTKGMPIPKISSIKSAGTGIIQIGWRKIDTATSYEVYRSIYKNSGFKKVAVVNGTSYRDSGVAEGTSYYYKIKCIYNDGKKSDYSNVRSTVSLGRVTVKWAKSIAGRGIKICWDKVSGATKYSILRKESGQSNYHEIKVVTNKNSYIDQTAKTGRTYSYVVKARTDNGGYGSFGHSVKGVRLKSVNITSAKSISSNKNQIVWEKVGGADYYQLYRSTTKKGEYKHITSTKKTSYKDVSVNRGKVYYYKVRAVKTVTDSVKGYGDFGSVYKVRNLGKVVINYVGSYSSTQMRITWKKVGGANYYSVYRSDSKGGTYRFIDTTKNLEYIDNSILTGKNYYYKVKAGYKKNGIRGYGTLSNAKWGKTMSRTSISGVRSLNSSTLEIRWKPVDGAQKYEVYRSAYRGKGYKKIATVRGKEYKDRGLTEGKTYYYKIRPAYKTKGIVGHGSDSTIKSGRVLKSVRITEIYAKSSNKMFVAWDKVTGATEYQVYRSMTKDGKYTKIVNLTGDSYTDKKVKAGKQYYYRVRAIKKTGKTRGYGSFGAKKQGLTIKQVRMKNTELNPDGSISISWNWAKNAQQYQIARSRKPNSGFYIIKTTAMKSYKDNPQATGETYYYKVRAINNSTGKRSYGSYSEPVSVTTGYKIMGASTVNAAQMAAYYRSSGKTFPADIYASKGAANIDEFCKIVVEEATAEGVRAEVLFAQICLETGFLQFGGDVQATQCNFGGLGATGGGVAGNVFPDVRTGIRAQVQHLKAYASTEPLKQTCVDERFKYVARGCAPYVEWLGIPDNPTGKGWAAAQGYGYNLLRIIGLMKKY